MYERFKDFGLTKTSCDASTGHRRNQFHVEMRMPDFEAEDFEEAIES